MSHENPFWVDIPTRSCIDDEGGSWDNIATFETRAEAVAFVRQHFDETADENGRIALITGGDADEQVPDVPAINAELLDLLKRYVESDTGIEDELTEEAAAAIAKAEGSAVA